MSQSDMRVSNAKNVACHLASSQLMFFVNLSTPTNRAVVGSVVGGKITSSQGEELPYTITLKVLNVGGNLNPPATIAALRGYEGSHALLRGPSPANSPSPYWSIENNELLSINLNAASFPDAVLNAPPDDVVELLRVKTKLLTAYTVDLVITCPAQAYFPPNYLRSISNPRLSGSYPGQDEATDEDDEDSSTEPSDFVGPGSARGQGPAVARQLNLSSLSPEAYHENGRDFAVEPERFPASYVGTADGRTLVQHDDILTVDATVREEVCITVHPERLQQSVLKRDFPVLGDIGAQLLIEVADLDDPRVAPKKERRRTTSSNFALRNVRRSNDQSGVEQAVNVTVIVTQDPTTGEKCVVISFNSEETHGRVDVEGLLQLDGYHETGRDTQNQENASYIVASCSNYVKDNYIISFSAVRAPTQVPSDSEVYIAVSSYLLQQAGLVMDGSGGTHKALSQSSLRQLQEFDLEEVRDYLFSLYAYYTDRATLEERQRFSHKVWYCTREWIVSKALGREEPLLEHVDGVVSDMLR